MKCLSWNCRGLELPRHVHELKALSSSLKPSLLFLCETKVCSSRLESLCLSLGFSSDFYADNNSSRGGLALFWHSHSLSLSSSSLGHIDVIVHPGPNNTGGPWWLMGFYGNPQQDHHAESWCLLQFLHSQSSLPWLCMGDFSEILENSNKVGRMAHRHPSLINSFEQTISACSLEDLGFKGPKFTWSNSRAHYPIYERLDRFFATPAWCRLFLHHHVHHLSTSTSDHLAIFLKASFTPSQTLPRQPVSIILNWLSLDMLTVSWFLQIFGNLKLDTLLLPYSLRSNSLGIVCLLGILQLWAIFPRKLNKLILI